MIFKPMIVAKAICFGVFMIGNILSFFSSFWMWVLKGTSLWIPVFFILLLIALGLMVYEPAKR